MGCYSRLRQASIVAPGQAGVQADMLCSQARVMKLVQDGRNVFLTGNAGTGKSFLLTYIIASKSAHGLRTWLAMQLHSDTSDISTRSSPVLCFACHDHVFSAQEDTWLRQGGRHSTNRHSSHTRYVACMLLATPGHAWASSTHDTWHARKPAFHIPARMFANSAG